MRGRRLGCGWGMGGIWVKVLGGWFRWVSRKVVGNGEETRPEMGEEELG